MNLLTLSAVRLSLGVTAASAVSYGLSWPLFVLTPLFTFMFLAKPAWIGAKPAIGLLCRLGYALFIGILISEFLLDYPLLSVPVYGLIFFAIYYQDADAAPPMSVLFMTLGVTLIPISSFAGAGVAGYVAFYLAMNMGSGLFIAWIFHSLLQNSIARVPQKHQGTQAAPATASPALPIRERARLALVSTLVSLLAVIIFFSLNLTQYALAMVFICLMAGTPNTNASLLVTKMNCIATCIGGIAAIIAFNLLVAVPTYPFLLAVIFLYALSFSQIIFYGGKYSKAFASGFSTFLILLGSSTSSDSNAAANFYLRIAQISFAGFFTIIALMVVEHILRPANWRIPRVFMRLRKSKVAGGKLNK